MAIFYVTSIYETTGHAGTLGDPYSLQEAADSVTGGNEAHLLNDGTYAPANTIDWDINAGSATAILIFKGVNADGTDDGTIVTLDGTGITGGELFNVNMAIIFIRFENFVLQNADTENFEVTTNVNAGRIECINVRFTGAGASGAVIFEGTQNFTIFFYQCRFDNNGTHGILESGAFSGGAFFFECSFDNNVSNGVESSAATFLKFLNCLFYNNVKGMNAGSSSGSFRLFIEACTFFNHSSDAISYNNTSSALQNLIRNSIIRSSGGYAINSNTGNIEFGIFQNNCYHNNTSGVIDINGGISPGTGHILSNPLFVNETGGSEDFALQAGSPCINKGIDGGIW